MNEGALAHPASRPSSRGSSEHLGAPRAPRGLTSWTGLAQKLLQPDFSVVVRSEGWRVRAWLGRGCTLDAGSAHSREISASGRLGRRGQAKSSGHMCHALGSEALLSVTRPGLS